MTARGAVVIEDRKQLAQHFAGGVIADVTASEGGQNAQFNSGRPARRAADDVFARAVMNALADGEMLNLSVATVGGVVRPGETTTEIVPNSEGRIAVVQIPPDERASIRVGQSVRAQLISHKAWQTPPLAGRVTDVSEDLTVDPETNATYYEARILISGDETAKFGKAWSLAGAPVQAFILSGVRRTLFQQVGEPIIERWFRGAPRST